MKKEDAMELLKHAIADPLVAAELLYFISRDKSAVRNYRVVVAHKLLRDGVKRVEASKMLSRRFAISRRRAYEILEMALNYA